jgi:hypothetical protein
MWKRILAQHTAKLFEVEGDQLHFTLNGRFDNPELPPGVDYTEHWVEKKDDYYQTHIKINKSNLGHDEQYVPN